MARGRKRGVHRKRCPRRPLPGMALLPRRGQNLDLVFSLQFERVVNRDTVSFQHLRLQIEPVR